MTTDATEPDAIEGYHAHVYYTAESKPEAAVLRKAVEAHFDIVMGRWRDFPVGPHPQWSYQIAFKAEQLGEILPFLILNRGDLDIFLHPLTGDDLADHRDYATWLGNQHELKLSVFCGKPK